VVDQRAPAGERLAPAGGWPPAGHRVGMAGAGGAVHELLLHGWLLDLAVGGASVQAAGSGVAPPHRGPRWAAWLGRSAAPAAAQGDDGFAAVAREDPVGGALVTAVQGQPAGHAADGPGAVAHVDLPGAASSHDRTPSRGTNRTGTRTAGGGGGWDRRLGGGEPSSRWLSLAAGRAGEASGAGEVAIRAGGAGQPPGSPGAAARAAPAPGGADGPVLVGVAGQLGAADPTAGHDQRLGPAQPLVQVQGDAAAHRRPPLRAT
jgi:hypothetical protein